MNEASLFAQAIQNPYNLMFRWCSAAVRAWSYTFLHFTSNELHAIASSFGLPAALVRRRH